MRVEGVFRGWIEGRQYCFIAPDGDSPDVFLHMNDIGSQAQLRVGARLAFRVETGPRGRRAREVRVLASTTEARGEPTFPSARGDHTVDREPSGAPALSTSLLPAADLPDDESLMSEDIEELDTAKVTTGLLEEIAGWKREAKAEDNDRYFWHVSETDRISKGDVYFVIGRKGSGKTAVRVNKNETPGVKV